MNCTVHPQNQAVAYCRSCGKALCEDCKRDVMGAIYCEPCIAARLQGQPAAAPGPVIAPPPVPPPGAPSPVLAGLLGFIPGVGAMYNGQFIKAFVHVVIFVCLIIAASTIHGAFGVLIAFWIFYMVFEAFKTAEARRMGLPAPDPLGLDKMFGLQESQQQVPPSTITGVAANPAMPTGVSAQVPMQPPARVIAPPPPPQDNAPVGAIVLIALGAIFLLSNNLPWFDAERVWPLFLIGIGLWIAYKRTSQRA
jgi:TM2 domain-containing membrane protein YozV